MTIGALIAFQLVFDLLLVLLLITVARQRRAPVAPPAWHDEFLQLAKEVMAVADSLLEAPERRADAPARPAEAPARRVETPEWREAAAPQRRATSARDEAFTLLRDGMEPDAVARRTGLLPGELRLITSLVAAQRRAGTPERRGDAPERRPETPDQAARTRQALPTAEVRRPGGVVEPVDFPELNSTAAPGTGLA